MSHAIQKQFKLPIERVLEEVPKALATEGFGVLTEIDVQATLKKKLGEDFRPYRILGACNPGLAHRALSAELDVGTFLPCNVAVYEDGEGGTRVSAVDPLGTIAASDNATLHEVATEVQGKLQRALDRLAEQLQQ